jgi:prepilin-type processing-associated H-X9-DG protein
LVCIGVVAVLLGLALPALSRAKRRAMELRCRSNLSECGRQTILYANDHREYFPTIVSDRITESTDQKARIEYHQQRWYLLITDRWEAYTGIARSSEVYRCPKNRRGGFDDWNLWTDYEYSASLYVRPDYFRIGAPRDPVSVGSRLQNLASISFPANKAILFETLVWHAVDFNPMRVGEGSTDADYQNAKNPGGVAFADGHVRFVRAADALPTVDQSWEWTRAPFSTTENGVRGRDVP